MAPISWSIRGLWNSRRSLRRGTASATYAKTIGQSSVRSRIVGSWTHVRLSFTNCDPEISGGRRDRGDTEVIVISNAFSGVDQALANSGHKKGSLRDL